MEKEPRFHKVERDGPVIIWKFNNPPKNLLTADTRAELDQLVEAFEADPDLRVAILTGEPPEVFIQHVDVSTILPRSAALRAATADQPPQPTQSAMGQAIQRHGPKPIICAMNGLTGGGGAVLALHCDFRFMSRKAMINFPEINLGLLGPWRAVVPMVGITQAMEILLLGKNIDADKAERIGLVNRVCEPEELMPATLEFAKELATRPPLSLALTKRCIYEGSEMSPEEQARLSSEAIRSDDCFRIMSEYVASGQDYERITR